MPLAAIERALQDTGVRLVCDLGYDGDIGLEYLPSMPTLESLALTRRTLGI